MKRLGRRDFGGYALILMGYLALCYLSWPLEGPFSIDLSRELTVPTRIANGERAYIDFTYLYGPFWPWLSGHLVRWFGDSLSLFFFISTSLTAVSLLGTFVTSRLFLRTWPATLLTAFLALAWAPLGVFRGAFGLPYSFSFQFAFTLATWILLPTVSAVFAYRHARLKSACFGLSLAAFLTGVSIITKIEFGILGLGVLAIALGLVYACERSHTHFLVLGFAVSLASFMPILFAGLHHQSQGGSKITFLNSLTQPQFRGLIEWFPYRYYFSSSIFVQVLSCVLLAAVVIWLTARYTKWVAWLPSLAVLVSFLGWLLNTLENPFSRIVPSYQFIWSTIAFSSLAFALFRAASSRLSELCKRPHHTLLVGIVVLMSAREWLQFGTVLRAIPNFGTAILLLPFSSILILACFNWGQYNRTVLRQLRVNRWAMGSFVSLLFLGLSIQSYQVIEHRLALPVQHVGGDVFRASNTSPEMMLLSHLGSIIPESSKVLAVQAEFIHRYSSFKNVSGHEQIVNSLLTEDQERDLIRKIEELQIEYIVIGLFNANWLTIGKDSLAILFSHFRSRFAVTYSTGDHKIFSAPLDFNIYSKMTEGNYIILKRKASSPEESTGHRLGD